MLLKCIDTISFRFIRDANVFWILESTGCPKASDYQSQSRHCSECMVGFRQLQKNWVFRLFKEKGNTLLLFLWPVKSESKKFSPEASYFCKCSCPEKCYQFLFLFSSSLGFSLLCSFLSIFP